MQQSKGVADTMTQLSGHQRPVECPLWVSDKRLSTGRLSQNHPTAKSGSIRNLSKPVLRYLAGAHGGRGAETLLDEDRLWL